MKLFLASKKTGSRLKTAKIKEDSKNIDIHISRSKGYKSVKIPKARLFRPYLIHGYLQSQNNLH